MSKDFVQLAGDVASGVGLLRQGSPDAMKAYGTEGHDGRHSWPWLSSSESPAAPVNSIPARCPPLGAHSR